MEIRDATDGDLPAIVFIYNDAVSTGTASWSETPVSVQERSAWLTSQVAAGNPVLVATGGAGEVLGYAAYTQWRPFDAYRHTVEDSIYLRQDARGKGIGTLLLRELIARARARGKHVMIAGIGADNAASLALHQRLGFRRVGTFPQVGVKFGRWLDLVFLQLDLRSGAPPIV